MQKTIMESATNNSQAKLGVNVTMVQCDQPILDVLVTIRGQRARMPEEKLEEREREISLIRGQWTKWEREKMVHWDVIKELQEFQDTMKKLHLLKLHYPTSM